MQWRIQIPLFHSNVTGLELGKVCVLEIASIYKVIHYYYYRANRSIVACVQGHSYQL